MVAHEVETIVIASQTKEVEPAHNGKISVHAAVINRTLSGCKKGTFSGCKKGVYSGCDKSDLSRL